MTKLTPAIKLGEIQKYGKISARGHTEIAAFFGGKKLSPLQAIKAYCYDCMGYYADGIVDCENPLCPLYPQMPYSPKHKDPAKVEAAKKRAVLSGFGRKQDTTR